MTGYKWKWNRHFDGDKRIGPRFPNGGFTLKEEMLIKHKKAMEDKEHGSKK
tara:strand:+ start:518 stop:670 length:153 start_codon:yes stop_codon:yes gene_type:complete